MIALMLAFVVACALLGKLIPALIDRAWRDYQERKP